MNGRFGSLLTAMVTPFDSEGKLDLQEAEALADRLASQGSEGLVVAGSTGEAATLSDGEKQELWRAVVGAVTGKAKVVAGSGTNSTEHSIELTRAAEKAGVDGALLVTPYYNRPPQEGLSMHFRAVAAATALPLLLYDIPSRTARKIEHRTMMELAGIDNIVGVKDACGDSQGAARIVQEAPDHFELYAGNDGDTFPWLALGAVGVIAVASHLAGPQMAEMIRLFRAGDLAAARNIHFQLMPLFDVLSLTTNPIPVKAALEMTGRRVGEPRLPLPPADRDQKQRISQVLAKVGVL